jgi:hypothetical protein
VYSFMLRRWAYNSTYTDVANPHNRVDDVHLCQFVIGHILLDKITFL